MTAPRRILLLRGGALGDFLLTLPAIRIVREQFPSSHIALIAGRTHAQFALHLGLINEWRDLESAALAPFFDPAAACDAEWSAWIGSFDLVINWLNDPAGVLQRRISGTRKGEVVFVQAIGRPDDAAEIHASRQLAAVLQPEPLRLKISDSNLTKPFIPARQSLDPHRLALHPGSGSPRKNWPADRWASLLLRPEMRERFQTLLLISGEAESESLGHIAQAAAAAGYRVDHARCLPLAELSAELLRSQCYAGHDSGVSHLAGLLGLPGVALFGPSNPDVWRPLGKRIRIIRASDSGPAPVDLIPQERVLAEILSVAGAAPLRQPSPKVPAAHPCASAPCVLPCSRSGSGSHSNIIKKAPKQ